MQKQKISAYTETSINDIPTPQETYRESVNNCPICDTILTFQHNIDYQYNFVQEDAECTSCGIRVRTQDFRLQ